MSSEQFPKSGEANNEVVTKESEVTKTEIPGGAALLDFYKKLDQKEQEKFLSNIGKNDPEKKEDNTGIFNKVGKALSGIADRLETNIENVMKDPGKRALFYAGLETVDRASRFSPIGQAQSPFGMIAGGFKEGVEKVKAEELAAANVDARSKSNLTNELALKKLEFEMQKPDEIEINRIKDLNKGFESIQRATQNIPLYGGMKKLIKTQLDKGDYNLPVGPIRSVYPLVIQSFAELLPASAKRGKKFFDKIEDDATFIAENLKYTDSQVLGDIGQLVPVSDKDIEVKRRTIANVRDPARAFLNSVRTQDALNFLNAQKYDFKDKFVGSRGFKTGSDRNLENEFNTTGATLIKNKIYRESTYTPDDIRKEATTLGFEPVYEKYTDKKVDFSPFALAEAKASLDMGGFAKYSLATTGAFEKTPATTIPGKEGVNPNAWQNNPELIELQKKYRKKEPGVE
jgi:hypothetical protein